MNNPREARQLRSGDLEYDVLKIKIGLHPNGNMKYPDFNSSERIMEVTGGMDWSIYIDKFGHGMMYDKKSKIADHNPEEGSPRGKQFAIMVVPEEFCDAACEEFPDLCEEIDEDEAEEFYDKRVTIEVPTEKINKDVLEGIRLKKELGLELNEEDKEALDPENPRPGIIRNKRKKWKEFKKHTRTNVISKTKIIKKRELRKNK